MAMDPLAPIKLGFRIGIGVLRWELRVLEHMLGLDQHEPPEAESVRVHVEPDPEPVPEPPPPPLHPVEDITAREPEPEEPIHVDTEPELVAEFAEPGAEDGAGPEIRVEEPWDGYAKMAASDVRDRVLVAGPEELAVVQLYETMHRKRRTVLDAVERRSKELANAPSAR
jgi:hypothetical protein